MPLLTGVLGAVGAVPTMFVPIIWIVLVYLLEVLSMKVEKTWSKATFNTIKTVMVVKLGQALTGVSC